MTWITVIQQVLNTLKACLPGQLKPQVPEGLAKRHPLPDQNLILCTVNKQTLHQRNKQVQASKKVLHTSYFYCKNSWGPKGDSVGETSLRGDPRKTFWLLSSPQPRKRKSRKVTQCLGHAVSPRASRLHPSPGPRLQPLRRTRPPVAALASGAESQAAARVRSNSLEKRLAGKPRCSEPANLQGRRGLRRASQPQAPFVSSRLSEHQKSTPDCILSPLLARARSRSAHTWEMLTRRDAHGGEKGPSWQNPEAQTGCSP